MAPQAWWLPSPAPSLGHKQGGCRAQHHSPVQGVSRRLSGLFRRYGVLDQHRRPQSGERVDFWAVHFSFLCA